MWVRALTLKIRILIQPRASKTEIIGIVGDRLKIRLQAPPVDGKANDVLVRYLARELALTRSEIVLKSGHTGRKKTLELPASVKLPSEWSLAVIK